MVKAGGGEEGVTEKEGGRREGDGEEGVTEMEGGRRERKK
jgi:hypothetical protein